MIDKNALQSISDEALRAQGYRLLELVVGADRRIRIVIDAEPDVDLKDCVRAHNAVIDALRAGGEDPEEYAIEVQSPGETRLLVTERDFERFRGAEVVVRLDSAAGPRRTLYGALLGGDGGRLRITERDSRSEMGFDLASVKEVRLHPK